LRWQAVPPIHIIVKNGDLTLEGVVAMKPTRPSLTSRQEVFQAYFP